jgi:hypothetical protein
MEMQMKKIVILVAIATAFALTGCTDEGSATRVLAQQGYKNIHMTGYKPFSCSDSDSFSTGFNAMSPASIQVSGTVCSGLLKGSTIRFD